MESWSVIVIGGGHAGIEAAWAASSALASAGANDAQVLLITMDPAMIGAMSCNPAIGGLAKGQMVREIDALGGIMGQIADATGIQFRLLNALKGAAVRGPRAQCDRHHYQAEAQRLIASRRNGSVPIIVVQGLVESFDIHAGVLRGVVLQAGAEVVSVDASALEWNEQAIARARSGERGSAVAPRMPFGSAAPRAPIQSALPSMSVRVDSNGSIRVAARGAVLTTGTFMRALMHTGSTQTPGGRVGEGSAVGISATLRALGFELGRLKTGTPPRLQRSTIDWESLAPQWGDQPPIPFSALSASAGKRDAFPPLPQVECRETRTSAAIHDLVRANLHLAPMYAGAMEAESGPRYCPSLEDKVVRFAQRESHHVFLEPESLATDDIYCNGISTSLPQDVQAHIIAGLPGCERAIAKRWGYAVEYDMVWPHQIDATGETKIVSGLFLAGQINGTSGYEEAASQGLVAGLNAARSATGRDMVRIGRDQAYIGVLMDDLVTRHPREPYRMFTSRAEFRLTLRADNAEDRLTALGIQVGLVDAHRAQIAARQAQVIADMRSRIAQLRAPPQFGEGKRLLDVARRPEVTAEDLSRFVRIAEGSTESIDLPVMDRVMTDVRYEGYLGRQRAELKRTAAAEHAAIPADLQARTIVGLGSEAIDVLTRFRPATLGQASRLAGVTPSDISILELTLRRRRRSNGNTTSC
ncbi:MAG: tRNA uridine-5-carboxymethylaminomethyl(34) synthesis enzyme MnmG [Phycisphaerales bacterium]|nr:tRNA uridine-5-carboxymethylaminomethyl(34) synthesis enzyme MnmG [Phycisphaerales bacterium]